MGNVVNRFRGGLVINNSTGAVTEDALGKFDLAPLGDPNFGTVSNSCDIYTAPVHLRQATDNDTVAPTVKAMAWFHITDTAGTSLRTGLTGASGDSGVLVMPDSTVDFNRGRVVSTSTGRATLVITSTGTSTARVVFTLANGLTVAGSTIIFT